MSVKLQKINSRAKEASSRQRHCSSSQLFTLPDTLQEAPALLDCLPPEARTALSSCNRELRAYFRSVTEIILVNQEDDVSALTVSDWPMLTMVVLRKTGRVESMYQLCGRQFKHLAMLKLADREQELRVDALLVPRRRGVVPQQVSTALLHFHQSQYAAVRELSFDIPFCTPLDIHSITNIVTASWEQLKVLYLSCNKLDANATRCLAKGVWPRLTSLCLMECGLDTAAMAGLVQGQWPELRKLDFSINPLLGGAAISMLASANWPKLGCVELACVPLSSGSFYWLSVKQWPKLSELDLKSTTLNASLVSELAHTHISHIRVLDLASNGLGADAMAALVTASMPVLNDLLLSENQLDAAAAQWLSRGEWPRLEALDLEYNSLDNEAMQHLAQVQWQRLVFLSLVNKNFDSDGLESLTKGDWTSLDCLQLDTSLGNAATWCLLDLDSQHLPDLCTKVEEKLCISVPRLEQGFKKFWQALQYAENAAEHQVEGRGVPVCCSFLLANASRKKTRGNQDAQHLHE